MQRYKILWADDEIELLKAHIIFLESKGYDVTPVNSGIEALEVIDKEPFDVVFLDENMPGMTGLEVLPEIKGIKPTIPVVMITKSEEEHIMEEAIGEKIADYLIKPLNPNQVLLSVKKLLHNTRLVSEKTNANYQQAFQQISMMYNSGADADEWKEIYKKLTYHEIEITQTEHKSMEEVLLMQKNEANANFCRFIEENYEYWMDDDDAPLMSHHLFKEKVAPELKDGKKVFFIIIDNLRYDQWLVIRSAVSQYLKVEEDMYYSILPTTTSHARNAIFSGLLPVDMHKKHPNLWKFEGEEGGLNTNEDKFLELQLKRLHLSHIKYSYHKIFNNAQGKQLISSLNNLYNNDLNTVVFNFVDMLSHARTDVQMIKDLAADESAYRSLAKSWFEHSPLLELVKQLEKEDVVTVLTTDHGTIRVDKPHQLVGEKSINSNLRYKHGRNMSYEEKNTFSVKHPEKMGLPKNSVSSSYVFAKENYFFAYPNNYNHYVKYYKDTFQHGGISLEEVLVPVVRLTKK